MTVTRHGRFCLPINAFELESVVLSVANDEPTNVVVFEVNLCDFLMEWALQPNDVLFLTKVEETGQVGMIGGCSVERVVDAAGRPRDDRQHPARHRPLRPSFRGRDIPLLLWTPALFVATGGSSPSSGRPLVSTGMTTPVYVATRALLTRAG